MRKGVKQIISESVHLQMQIDLKDVRCEKPHISKASPKSFEFLAFPRPTAFTHDFVTPSFSRYLRCLPVGLCRAISTRTVYHNLARSRCPSSRIQKMPLHQTRSYLRWQLLFKQRTKMSGSTSILLQKLRYLIYRRSMPSTHNTRHTT